MKGVVECSGKDLKTFPSRIPEWTKFLSVEQTSITDLQSIDLENLPDLLVFKFQKHKSLKIGPNLFSNNRKLFSIHLSNNQLTELNKRVFEGLTLDTLDLTSNKLSVFEANYMEGVLAVKKLYLQSNRLQEIEDDSLTFVSNLTDLYLNYNNLKKAPGTKTEKAHTKVESKLLFKNNYKLV